MRVLWVIKEFGLGGAERLLLELLPYAGEVEFLPVSVMAGPLDLVPAFREAGVTPRVLSGKHQLDARWVAELRRLAKGERPDVVHLHLPYTGVGGRLAVRGLRVPVVYTEHNVWHVYRASTRWANEITFGLNDAVIAVSEAVRASILRSWNGRRIRDRIRVVPNGIDADRVRSQAESAPGVAVPAGAFGTVTTLTSRKGVDVLVRAAARLQDEFPDRSCLIVGGGEWAEEVRKLIGQVGARNVFLVGARTDARSIMARLNVVIIPSRFEGLPLVLLEAMALGSAIVATAVGGIPDVVQDGVSALLVPPNDDAALAETVARVLRDPALAARLGERARAAVDDHWHARRTAAEHVRIYADVLAR